jgi:hypothetical protein
MVRPRLAMGARSTSEIRVADSPQARAVGGDDEPSDFEEGPRVASLADDRPLGFVESKVLNP